MLVAEEDSGFDFLCQKNAAVLTMLPLLLQDLIRAKTPYEALISLLQQELDDSWTDTDRSKEIKSLLQQVNERKSELTNQHRSFIPVLNEDKSLLLLFTFGEIYLDAIKIAASSGAITVNVYSSLPLTEQEATGVANNYMSGKDYSEGNKKEALVIAKVTEPGIATKSKKRRHERFPSEPETPLIYDLKALLQILGISFNSRGEINVHPGNDAPTLTNLLSVQQAEEESRSLLTVPTTSHGFVVDLATWYCTCTTYQRFYSEQDLSHTSPDAFNTKSASTYLPAMVASSELLKDARVSGSNIITKLLTPTRSECETKHLSRLPICAHLLAVLIAAANSCPHVPLYEVVVQRDVLQMLT